MSGKNPNPPKDSNVATGSSPGHQKKHDTERTAKVGKYNFNDTNTRQTFQEREAAVYEDYAQSHAKLHGEISKKIRPPEPDRQGLPSRNEQRPDHQLKPVSIPANVPFRDRPKPQPRRNSKGIKKGKSSGSDKGKRSEDKGEQNPESKARKQRHEQKHRGRI